MIKQCKGKDLSKVPYSRLEDSFYASTKYDGHYVQIHKNGDRVKFYTSGGKEFYLDHIANELCELNINKDFILEAEYIADTTGKLGSRGKAARLTTYRTNFEKGIPNRCIIGKDKFKVFDIIPKNSTDARLFHKRLAVLKTINFGTHLDLVTTIGPSDLATLKQVAAGLCKEGYEGLYLKTPNHEYLPGKRVNNAIKLKLRPTADLKCIAVTEGEGKYTGLIGSLVLQDSKGRTVSVGSGLCDRARKANPKVYLKKVIEIEYEQILDTYIQPTYVGIRVDKTIKEID